MQELQLRNATEKIITLIVPWLRGQDTSSKVGPQCSWNQQCRFCNSPGCQPPSRLSGWGTITRTGYNIRQKNKMVFPSLDIEVQILSLTMQTKGNLLTLIHRVGYLQEPAAPLGLWVLPPIEEEKSTRVLVPLCWAQNHGQNPKANPQSSTEIRHFESSPFPISLHLSEALHTNEQQSLCVKLIKLRREVRLGAPVRDASAGVRRKQPRNSFRLHRATGLHKSKQPKISSAEVSGERKRGLVGMDCRRGEKKKYKIQVSP